MLFWAVDNPPPANYLLISGDRDFSNALHQLRMWRYNILLAQPINASQALVAAAKSVWCWTSLVVGGPPIQIFNTQLGNVTSANILNMESKESVEPLQSSQFANQNVYGVGKGDSRLKEKKILKQPSQNLPRTSTNEVRQSIIGTVGGPNNVTSNHKVQTSEVPELSNPPSSSFVPTSPVKVTPPHELFGANKPKTSSSTTLNLSPPLDNYQVNTPQLSSSSDLPSQPNISPGNSLTPNALNSGFHHHPLQPKVPLFTSGFLTNIPDINRVPNDVHRSTPFSLVNPKPLSQLSLNTPRPLQNTYGSQNAMAFSHNNVQNRSSPQSAEIGFCPASSMAGSGQNNGVWETSGSEVAPFHIGNILRALHILKSDKMFPSEGNLQDCIHYGEINLPSFNVRMGLDYAMKQRMVVRLGIGATSLYIGKNDRLWNCVNDVDINAKHPKATWDKVQSFLSSAFGRSEVLGSQCRYQAAIVLKKFCLKNHALGDIIQILQFAISVKKWIVPHHAGWQPLSITLPLTESTNPAVGSSTIT